MRFIPVLFLSAWALGSCAEQPPGEERAIVEALPVITADAASTTSLKIEPHVAPVDEGSAVNASSTNADSINTGSTATTGASPTTSPTDAPTSSSTQATVQPSPTSSTSTSVTTSTTAAPTTEPPTTEVTSTTSTPPPTANLFPDLVVTDVATGASVNLQSLGGSTSVVLWFWAPH